MFSCGWEGERNVAKRGDTTSSAGAAPIVVPLERAAAHHPFSDLEHRPDAERGREAHRPLFLRERLGAEWVVQERNVDDEHQQAGLPQDREVEPAVRERTGEGRE